MTARAFDPYRAERRLRRANQWARWRAAPAQSALHAFALLIGTLLVAPLLLQGARAALATLEAGLLRAPLALAATWFVLSVLLQTQARVRLERRAAQDWWRAQPIAAALQRRRAWRAQAQGGVPALLLVGAALATLAASAITWIVMLAAFAGAALLAPPLAPRLRRADVQRAELRARRPDPGVGRLWRWQLREAEAALRGKPLAGGLVALLLVPMDGGAVALALVGGGGLAVAALGGGWRRSLRVLPRAQAWLGAQPLAPRDLLRAACAVPAAGLALASCLLIGLLLALGTPALAAPAGLALLWTATLHFAAVFAERRRPRRAAFVATLHLLGGLALLQALPPLALLAWPLQLAWLLRRGLAR